MQDLIDIINERKEDVNEIMSMLTERNEEEDNQDLLDELDAEIAKEDKNKSEAASSCRPFPRPSPRLLPSLSPRRTKWTIWMRSWQNCNVFVLHRLVLFIVKARRGSPAMKTMYTNKHQLRDKE